MPSKTLSSAMNKTYLRFLVVCVLIVALQVWLLSPVALFRVATPYLYPVLLLLLPINTGKVSLLVHAFVIGTVIDILGLTPGLHAASLTAAAFARPMLLGLLEDKKTPEQALPLYGTLRTGAAILISLLLLIHHVILYALEAGTLVRDLHVVISFGAGYGLSLLLCLITLAFIGSFGEGHDS